MTRVSENSATAALNFSVGKTKSSLEDLQIKGSNLKRIQKPSDDPAGNTELMSIRSRATDAKQFGRSATFAKTQLNIIESSLADIGEIIVKAKELAIGQASNYYSPEVRRGVAYEIEQLRNQALSIANNRVGQRYLFSGHKTLTRPFNKEGQYFGDQGKTHLEVDKDVFVPINLPGSEVFFDTKDTSFSDEGPLERTVLAEHLPDRKNSQPQTDQDPKRQPATEELNETQSPKPQPTSLFDHLLSLQNALITDNHTIIQDLLDKFDDNFDRLNSLRAKVGSLTNTVDNAEITQEKEFLIQQEQKSKIEDADVAELFSELEKQKNVLTATYKSGSTLINQTLLDFLR